jgi:protein O-GlcNAc transferase
MEPRWELEQPERNEADAVPQAPARARRRGLWLVLAGVIAVVGVAYFLGNSVWRPGDRGPRTTGPVSPGTRDRTGPWPAEENLPADIGSPSGEPASTPQGAAEALRSEAIEVANRLIKDLPDRPEPVALLALAHSRFGNGAEAMNCWERCLKLDPDFAGAYDGMGRIALNRGKCEEAAAHLRKALAMAPNLPEVRGLLADGLMRLGNTEEAVVVLEEDLRLFPENAESLFRLGKAYQQLKEHEKAKEKFEAAIKIDPACTDAYYRLSGVCARLGLRDEAQKHREEFQRLKAADAEASEGRRQALYRPERLPEVVASICLAAGNVYSRHGDLRKAEPRWLRAAMLAPKDVAPRHQLALAYLRENRMAEARQMLGQLRQIEPENLVHLLNLGFLSARLGEFDAAQSAFRTACRLAPQSPAGYVALVQLYLQANSNLSEARELAQTAVTLDPSAPNYSLLSTACDRAGDAAGALSAIEKAMELAPENAAYRRVYERIQGEK